MFLIIGLVVVFGSVVGGYVPHGDLRVLWQPFEFVIILGAALGGFIISNPKEVTLATGKHLGRLLKSSHRPRFTGERLVQILGCFFMCVQGFIEHLLCFVRRDISDGAVKTLGVVPIDPFQRFPFKLAH